MAKRNVATVVASDNRPNLVELGSAVLHAAAKVASKEADRDELTAGRTYDVRRLAITAEIDGQPFSACYDVSLTVGHDTERAAAAPSANVLLAYVLAQLAPAHREAVLRNMPADYANNGGSLPVQKEFEEAAKAALQRLRAGKAAPVRGTVSAQYAPAAPIARRGKKAV